MRLKSLHSIENQNYRCNYKTDVQLVGESVQRMKHMETLIYLPTNLRTGVIINFVGPHPPSLSFQAFHFYLKQILPLEFRKEPLMRFFYDCQLPHLNIFL